jgi:hypothetical protein
LPVRQNEGAYDIIVNLYTNYNSKNPTVHAVDKSVHLILQDSRIFARPREMEVFKRF